MQYGRKKRLALAVEATTDDIWDCDIQNKSLIFTYQQVIVINNQYRRVLIDDAVSHRGNVPFSKSGNLKFEITKYF